ncbi:cysteine hydrolase family protein [Chloroflexota bacterium]
MLILVIPVIYIQSVRTLQEAEFTVFGHLPNLEIGTWASEIIEELKPHERDIIVQKFSHDPFFRKDLDEVLQGLIPDPTNYYAVVTGGAINVCVYHAVMGFYLRDYWTVIPLDSVYYPDDAGNQRAIEQFSSPAYTNIFLSRSDLIEASNVSAAARPTLIPGN